MESTKYYMTGRLYDLKQIIILIYYNLTTIQYFVKGDILE